MLKSSYRMVYVEDMGEMFYSTEKAADAKPIECKDCVFGLKNLPSEFDPEFDLELKENDDRWPLIKDIIATG